MRIFKRSFYVGKILFQICVMWLLFEKKKSNRSIDLSIIATSTSPDEDF